jgi:hypothetical protein
MEHETIHQCSNTYLRNNRTVGIGIFCAIRPGGCVTAISQLQEKLFAVGSVQRLYLENRNSPISKHIHSRREWKSWSWISRRLKPGMTALARASSNLTDLPKSVSRESRESLQADRPVRVWGSYETVASGGGVGGGGASIVVSRCVATPS